MTDKDLKKSFLKILHGGKLDRRSREIPVLIEFEAAVKQIIELLARHPSYSAMYEAIGANPRKPNASGTFISHVWQKSENEVILALKSFLDDEGYSVGCLCFDGIMVELGGVEIDSELLAEAEDHIFAETEFRVSLVEKDLTPTPEDWEKYHGPKAINKILSNAGKCTYLLERHGQLAGLKRMENHVRRPHQTIPGVYVMGEEDHEFINSVLEGAHGVGSMKPMQDFFNATGSKRFPLLTRAKMDNNAIAFQNGFFDIDKVLFTSWDDWKEAPPFTEHYFDKEITEETHLEPTPLWDKILLQQMDPECKAFVEVLIGRLFYPVGKFDTWQVMPFLLGSANTGKSCLLDLIRAMFPEGSVGCITAGKEATFGLESLIDKRLVQAPDLPDRLKPILAQSDFQSMVSGDQVNIARKNQKAVSNKPWRVPMIWAGNQFPQDYRDTSGSVSRRLVVIKFLELVTDRDSHLKWKITEAELVTIMLRCIRAYRAKVSEIGAKEFWDHVPRVFVEGAIEVKESNYLQKFLAEGSSSWQVLHKKGASTPLKELERAFSQFMEEDVKKYGVIGQDHHPIRESGFTMKSTQYCSECLKPSSKAGCGPHYNDKNRVKKVCIIDMALVRVPLMMRQ